MWINIQVFDSIPLVKLIVFMPVSSCFHYCSSIMELDITLQQLKNNDILNFACKLMEFGNIIPSEVTQTPKDDYGMYSLISEY